MNPKGEKIYRINNKISDVRGFGGILNTELFATDPSRFLENAIKEYVRTTPLNQLVTFNSTPIFDEPVVTFAKGDNPVFQSLKTIVGEFHLTPREAMEKYIKAKRWRYGVKSSIESVSVICWALPIPEETRLSERQASLGGSKRYNHTRWMGGPFMESLKNYVATLLEILGHNAVAPASSGFFETREMEGGWRVANWSERHIAYACSMGTFGLNGLMITPKGCAAYLGSVVCDAALTPTPNIYPSHVANCLFYQNGSCRQCLERCIAKAISEEGRNNIICARNLRQEQGEKLKSQGLDRDLIGMAPACGRCSTGVPCEHQIPRAASANAPS
jgi:epoxyqueuosine reductase